MNKFFIALIMMCTMAFAGIHPALKNAIDNGDIKTAQSLVQKIGVQDIYCPTELSFDDAMKIYGKSFENNSSKIWKYCESGFIENMEKKACEKSISLCKEILRKNDESEWIPFVKQIVKNKLNQKKKKMKFKKEVPVKVSKKECRANYREAELYYQAIKEEFLKISCDPSDVSSFLMCPLMKTQFNDSLDLLLEKHKALCEKKSMILKEIEFEEDVVANSFWYEAEKFGSYISLKMSNVFDSSKTIASLYDEFIKGKPDISSSNVYLTINEIFKKNEKETVMKNLGLACHVFPNIKEYFNETKYSSIIYKAMYNTISDEENLYVNAFDKWLNFARTNGFDSRFFDCSQYPYTNSLGYDKKDVMKSIVSSYAEQGFINYWEVSFFCKRFPGLEKELQKQTEIEMYNCNVLDDFKQINETCIGNDSTFVWEYFYLPASARYPFVCENRNWRGFTKEESVTGKLCEYDNQGELVDGYICDKREWRNASYEENQTGKICNSNLDQKVENGYLCENNTWIKLQGKDAELGVVCQRQNQGLFVQKYVCDVMGWRAQTWEESATHKLCTEKNQGEFVNNFVCDKNGWRLQTDGEQKTRKICSSLNSNEMINGYVCRIYQESLSGNHESPSYQNNSNKKPTGYLIRRSSPKENTWDWVKASKQEFATKMVCTPSNVGKKRNGYLCDEKLGWIKDLDYGKVKDERDGQVYRTVKIGKQEWMAENLRYKSQNNYYRNSYFDEKRFYETYDYSFHSSKNVCPDGWEVPSKRDWKKLFKTIGGSEIVDDEYDFVKDKLLAEKVGGSNEYGFAATDFDFWTSSSSDERYQSKLYVSFNSNGYTWFRSHYIGGTPEPNIRHSIRCIKD